MAREVNLTFTGWRATGTNVQVPQYEIQVTHEITRNNGTKVTRTRTVRFPNFLAQVPQEWLEEELKDLLIRAARKLDGVDDE